MAIEQCCAFAVAAVVDFHFHALWGLLHPWNRQDDWQARLLPPQVLLSMFLLFAPFTDSSSPTPGPDVNPYAHFTLLQVQVFYCFPISLPILVLQGTNADHCWAAKQMLLHVSWATMCFLLLLCSTGSGEPGESQPLWYLFLLLEDQTAQPCLRNILAFWCFPCWVFCWIWLLRWGFHWCRGQFFRFLLICPMTIPLKCPGKQAGLQHLLSTSKEEAPSPTWQARSTESEPWWEGLGSGQCQAGHLKWSYSQQATAGLSYLKHRDIWKEMVIRICGTLVV